MKALLRHAGKSEFLRNVTVLSSGSFIGLLIPLLLLPVFTRIYSAELYGIQALLLVGMMALAPLATGYFELAIPTPKKDIDARRLAANAIALTLAVTFAALAIIHLAKHEIITLLKIPDIGIWMYAFPIVGGATAITNIANYWLVRTEKFGTQGMVKIIGAIATAILAYGSYLMHIGDGLLVGCVGGLLIAAAWGYAQMLRHGYKTTAPSRTVAKRYKQFPLYGSIPNAVYNLAAHVPLLIITASYSLHVAGHYAVTRNILFVGVNLIALCVGQVLLKHVAELAQKKKPIWPYFLRVTTWLALFGVALAAGVYLVGPWFFTLYLGNGWEDAAAMTRQLAPVTFFWLMGPTLAQAAIAVHKIKPGAAWLMLYGLSAPYLLSFTALPFDAFLARYIAFDMVMYGLYAVAMLLTIQRYDRA